MQLIHRTEEVHNIDRYSFKMKNVKIFVDLSIRIYGTIQKVYILRHSKITQLLPLE